jgi:flavin reductase (DIM6/NTAB) family NADH-FMN oxidoreductase RutF
MRCATEPVLIACAARKGHSIEPLIRDSHHFAMCIIRPDDRLVLHKFPEGGEPRGGDPFDAIPHESLGSGSPVPIRSMAAFDCEVVRHFDLDADHEIYVGQVLTVKVYQQD